MDQVSASEALALLPELLDRVEGGEEIAITRRGRPVAMLVPFDALGPLGLSPERADELVAGVRADRDGRDRSVPT